MYRISTGHGALRKCNYAFSAQYKSVKSKNRQWRFELPEKSHTPPQMACSQAKESSMESTILTISLVLGFVAVIGISGTLLAIATGYIDA
jgi:hypothetical protein